MPAQPRETLRIMMLAEFYKKAHEEWHEEGVFACMHALGGSIWSREEVQAAIEFLIDAKYLAARFKPLGASQHLKITAEGTLMMEREYHYAIGPGSPASATSQSRVTKPRKKSR